MDAVALLENLKLKVKIIGTGKVKKQSIPPGEALDKNKTIILELKDVDPTLQLTIVNGRVIKIGLKHCIQILQNTFGLGQFK